MNQNHSPTPPSHLSKAKTPLQSGAANNTGLLLSTVSGWRAFFQEGAGCQYFSSCPQLPVPEAKFQVSVVLRWLLSSPHYWMAESATRMLRPDHLTWLHEVVVACQKRQAKNILGTASPPPKHSGTTARTSVKENCVTGPTPRAPAQVLCLGENWGIKQIAGS